MFLLFKWSRTLTRAGHLQEVWNVIWLGKLRYFENWSLKGGGRLKEVVPSSTVVSYSTENAYDGCNPTFALHTHGEYVKSASGQLIHNVGAYSSFCNTTSEPPMWPSRTLSMLIMVYLWRSGAIVEKCNSVPAYHCLFGCLWTPRIYK